MHWNQRCERHGNRRVCSRILPWLIRYAATEHSYSPCLSYLTVYSFFAQADRCSLNSHNNMNLSETL
ncbi:hypothetical protein DAI22_01g029200 [Oryza sativa Japonica Group]|nr:hypothetical protein DAI22_01g029200 [Oryza sativa Japonica Group]